MVDGVGLHLAVAEEDVARGVLGNLGVVGHEDDGVALIVEFLEEDKHLKRRACVEVTGGLVGEDDGGVVDERTGDGYSLHLTTRHLVGLVLQTIAETNFDKCLDGTRAALLGLDFGIVHQGQFDVLDGRGLGQQVVVLEDETNLAVTELGALIAAHPAHRHAIEVVFARSGCVEATYLVEQCGFARARSALDGHELTFVDLERDTTERMDHLVADLEVAANVLEFDDDFSIVFAHIVRV